MSRRGPPRFLLRLAAEFVVIVIGVLTALGVEGWSQEQAAMRAQEDYLVGLEADFIRNLEIAEEVRSEHATAVRRAESLLEIVESDGPGDLSYDSIASMIEFAGWNRTLPFVWDTWDDMISTGNVDLLGPEVRQQIQGVFNRLERLELMESEWYGYQQDYRIAVSEVIPWSDRVVVSDRMLAPESAIPADGDAAALTRRLRTVDGVRGKLAEVVIAHRGGTASYAALISAMEQLLGQITRQLGPE